MEVLTTHDVTIESFRNPERPLTQMLNVTVLCGGRSTRSCLSRLFMRAVPAPEA